MLSLVREEASETLASLSHEISSAHFAQQSAVLSAAFLLMFFVFLPSAYRWGRCVSKLKNAFRNISGAKIVFDWLRQY